MLLIAAAKREPVCRSRSAHAEEAHHSLSSVVSQKSSATCLTIGLDALLSLAGSAHQSGKVFLYGQASVSHSFRLSKLMAPFALQAAGSYKIISYS